MGNYDYIVAERVPRSIDLEMTLVKLAIVQKKSLQICTLQDHINSIKFESVRCRKRSITFHVKNVLLSVHVARDSISNVKLEEVYAHSDVLTLLEK